MITPGVNNQPCTITLGLGGNLMVYLKLWLNASCGMQFILNSAVALTHVTFKIFNCQFQLELTPSSGRYLIYNSILSYIRRSFPVPCFNLAPCCIGRFPTH